MSNAIHQLKATETRLHALP